MYAVIRSGGKQYRVSPGDELRLEKLPQAKGQAVEWRDLVALTNEQGQFAAVAGARVTGTVLEQDRGAKVLVFHYKRKKQYKKLQGHRQAYTRVRINQILPA